MKNLLLFILLVVLQVLVLRVLAVCNRMVKYVKKLSPVKMAPPPIDDGAPGNFYITGDKHRSFRSIESFCQQVKTTPRDVMIILGDAGFNYFGDVRDVELKTMVCSLPLTFFCVHGNKENRPQNIGTYGIRNFYGGKVYYEPQYPRILFAIDGEVYRFNDKEYLIVGGAHSVDKKRCLEEGLPFWEDEMPDESIKRRVEQVLAERGNKIYGILTHTCPLKYLPIEMFMSTRRNAEQKRKPRKKQKKIKTFEPDIDRSTEEWLDHLADNTDFTLWYCGHYHIDKSIDNLHMMHNKIRLLDVIRKEDEWENSLENIIV